MPGRPRLFNAYDLAFDGELGPTLLNWKADGLSVEDIAYRLRSDHDIKVSAATVYRWLAAAETEQAAG